MLCIKTLFITMIGLTDESSALNDLPVAALYTISVTAILFWSDRARHFTIKNFDRQSRKTHLLGCCGVICSTVPTMTMWISDATA